MALTILDDIDVDFVGVLFPGRPFDFFRILDCLLVVRKAKTFLKFHFVALENSHLFQRLPSREIPPPGAAMSLCLLRFPDAELNERRCPVHENFL